MSESRFQRILDQVGRQILTVLQENARISYSELGRRVALSAPAVIERVRKMEDAGIISGYHTHVDPQKVGWPIMAFVSLSTRTELYARVIALAEREAGILECHHVSGNESFVMKVIAPSVQDLETLIEQLSLFGQTKTLIVLSSPVNKPGLSFEDV